MTNSNYELKHIDFNSLSPPKPVHTRLSELIECECSVCFTGRLNGRDYIDYKELVSKPFGRPPVSSCGNTEQSPLVICGHCLSGYKRGISHYCSKITLQDNAVNLGKICNI